MTTRNTLNNLLVFAAGAIVGSIVAWKVLEKKIEAKYELLIQEEIDSIHECLGRPKKNDICEGNVAPVADEKNEEMNVKDYAAILAKEGYTNYSDVTKNTDKEVESMEKPYVIEPEKFGEIDDYEVISFVYYADGVLTDDADEPISDDDIDDIIGKDSLTHFGEYEDDSVFVRNDRLKSDYEILFDSRNYDDVHPPRVGG